MGCVEKEMVEKLKIAIDGPASAGKSTVAKILAEKLNYIYCDTGAMYRTLTYMALKENAISDEDYLVKLLDKAKITFAQRVDGQHVFLNNQDVTEVIRQTDVTNNVSAVSAFPKVRKELVKRQQEIAKEGGIVMDGRDIGTAVLPLAEVKFFLVASVEERAMRRYKENLSKNIKTEFETLKQEIERRDYLDTTRKVSPLTQAKDAKLIDTTGLNIQEVVAEMLKYIQNLSVLKGK